MGAGPAGMLLAHLLRQDGVDCLVLENRDRDHVEGRVRAGVLERLTVGVLDELGLGARLHREGLVHGGTNIAFDGDVFRIDMADLTGGGAITVYGQQEVMKDLFDAAADRGLQIVWSAEDVALHDLQSDRPGVTWRVGETMFRAQCDFIIGCDGAHGVCRSHLTDGDARTFERTYPFGWLGVLAEVPPCNVELIYANHERGFALASMRSATHSRYYLQCGLGEQIEDWPDDRFWEEVRLRLGPSGEGVVCGRSFEKSIAPLRSFVIEPMRCGRLFLAGDAAHIVPPTGAKGLNLAVSDALLLSRALATFYGSGRTDALETYSDRALARVWKAERFSWWFTGLTHRFPTMEGFDRKMQIAELSYIRGSRAAQMVLAENYVGLPLEEP